MVFLRRLLMFICFVIAGTFLSSVGISNTPDLLDLIVGIVGASIIVIIRPDIFRLKKKSV